MSGRGAKMVAMVREIDVEITEPLVQIINNVNNLPCGVEVNDVCLIQQYSGEVHTGNAIHSAFKNGTIRRSCSEDVPNNLPGAPSVGDITLEQTDIQILDNLVCTIIQDTESINDKFQVICGDENANENVGADME
ncbi:hypothetical protein JTB14_000711 [Gonioctena quinquepunctata]|nr:hypothetical protein JTB14_000711 [Gonioctena quinquepunctata]